MKKSNVNSKQKIVNKRLLVLKLKWHRYMQFNMAVAILLLTAIYPQRLFCCELFVIGQSKQRTKHVTFGRF